MEKGFSIRRLAVVLSVSAMLWLPAMARDAFAKSGVISSPRHVPGEFIVKVKAARVRKMGVSTQAFVKNALVQSLGAASVQSVSEFKTDSQLQLVKLARTADLDKAIQSIQMSDDFEYAEPNYIMSIGEADSGDGVPNDTDFSKLWGMQNTGQADSSGQVGTQGSDINVVKAWKEGITGSRNVVVAVIDTGIQWDHPDLKDNIFVNTGEVAGNDKDDDGNGFKDDVHGWNFAAKNNNSSDDHSHGTHCAGTIGGMGNNTMGVAGVNWQVTMMPIKFLTKEGSGTLQGAVESINYARLMKVDIMSNSWGGGGFTQSLKEAIEKARDAGILFVAAAGNEKNDNDRRATYPATYDVDNIVSVAASDNKDMLASFSNYGAKKVHVSAPGVRILSTVIDGKYATYSGTSMATPHVAGIAALIISANPGIKYAEIKRRLIATSDRVSTLRSRSISKGRVNAYNAIKDATPPNDDPDESLWRTVDYAVESAHPYASRSDLTFTITQTGAKYIRVIFEKVDLEASYDKLFLKNKAGEVVSEVTGTFTNVTSDYVMGDTVILQLKSDDNVNAYGFKISKIQVIN